MPRAFISHSSHDNPSAQALAGQLRDAGFEQLFLDFSADDGIRAGSDWEQTLHEQLARCHAVLLLLTPRWLASKWCFAEFVMARGAGKLIVPIVIEACDARGIAGDLQHVDFTQDRADGLRRVVARLREAALDAQGGFGWVAGRAPYPGLAAFQADDAAVYFGREVEIRALTERLESHRVAGQGGVVALLGASGSGKSSLVRAGVLPRLSYQRGTWCVMPPLRPREAPLTALARAWAALRGDAASATAIEQRLRDGVVAALVDDTLAATGAGADATLLITIDQAEELFTTTAAPERAACAAVLHALARPRSRAIVLLTIRSELFGAWQQMEPALPKADVLPLAPLPVDRLAAVVEGPARVAGFGIDPGVALAIAADATGRDALPLVAFALRELHAATIGRRERPAASIGVDDYLRLGDAASGLRPLQAIVCRRADAVLAALGLDAAGERALAAAFVERLVNVDDKGVFTRRTARWRDIEPAAARPLEAFVDARLLVSRLEDDERVVEVAHEALLRNWPTLVRWLAAESDFLAGRRRLDEALAEWQRAPAPQRDAALLRGLLLQRARAWAARRPGALANAALGYIAASAAADDAARARERRQRGVLVALGVLALALVGWAVQSWRSGQALERDVEAQRLLRLSTAAIDARRADVALAQAAAAWRISPDARSHSALLQAGLALSPHAVSARAATTAGAPAPTVIAWPADGAQWLVGDAQGAVHAVARSAGTAVQPLHPAEPVDKNRPRPVLALVAAAGGAWSAVRGDGSWLHGQAGGKVGSGTPSLPPLQYAALAPDGQAAVVVTEGARAVLLVDCAAAPCQSRTLDLAAPEHAAAAWSTDGAAAAIVLGDGRVALVDRAGRRAVQFAGAAGTREPKAASVLAWVEDGRWLVGDSSGAQRVVGAEPAQGVAAEALDAASRIKAVAPGGNHLAAACELVRVCLWRRVVRADGTVAFALRAMLAAHADPVAALAWSADGQRLVSIDIGGRAVEWRADLDDAPAAWLDDLAGDAAVDLAVDARGKRFAAARQDGAWAVWSSAPARLLQRGAEPAWRDLRALAWHPAAPVLALASLASGAGVVRIDGAHDAAARVQPLDWGGARVEALGWAPDGSRLYGALQDGNVVASAFDRDGRVAGPARAVALGEPHAEAVLALAVAPDGAVYSSDALGVVRIALPGSAGRTAVDMKGVAGAAVGLDAVSLAPDGARFLVAGNHGDVFVFARASNALEARLETGASMITSAAFSPDGRHVAALDDQQRLHLWAGAPPFAAVANVRLRSLPGHAEGDRGFALGALRRLAWLDATRLAVATQSGHVVVLAVNPDPWLARAAALAPPPAPPPR